MIIATATSNASRAFHQQAACSQAAAPVPAITGATALGSVRGRAPSIHCAKLATSAIVPCRLGRSRIGNRPYTGDHEGPAHQGGDPQGRAAGNRRGGGHHGRGGDQHHHHRGEGRGNGDR